MLDLKNSNKIPVLQQIITVALQLISTAKVGAQNITLKNW
mgnify:CR=1 FL=1